MSLTAPPCDVIMIDNNNNPGVIVSTQRETLAGGTGLTGYVEEDIEAIYILKSTSDIELFNATLTVYNTKSVTLEILDDGAIVNVKVRNMITIAILSYVINKKYLFYKWLCLHNDFILRGLSL